MKVFNIRFRRTKKVYPFFIDNDLNYLKGDYVIVETIRGDQIGVIVGETNKYDKTLVDEDGMKIRGVKRKLNSFEKEKLTLLDNKAYEAYFICKKIVREKLPEMNLVIGEYTFDENKLIFYFTAEYRLDFRELVKEVNKTFKKRVEFYQIKPNDEGRILSAFGRYGKEMYW